MTFLEFLADEESESWIAPMLEEVEEQMGEIPTLVNQEAPNETD